MHDYLCYAVYYMTVWRTYSSFFCYVGNLSPVWASRSYTRRWPVIGDFKTSNEIERDTVLILFNWLTWFSVIVTLLHTLLSSSWSWLPPAFEWKYKAGQYVCFVSACLSESTETKEELWGVRQNLGHTSVCRSMISWPIRGMVALVFSHSTVCSSRGEATTVSRSFRTQDGGELVLRMPSHALLLGVCCLSWRG